MNEATGRALKVKSVDNDPIDVTSGHIQMFESTSRYPGGDPINGWKPVVANQSWPANAQVFQQQRDDNRAPDYYVCFQVIESTVDGITDYAFETVTWYQRGNQPLRLQDERFTQIDPAGSGPPAGFFQGASSMFPCAAAQPNKR